MILLQHKIYFPYFSFFQSNEKYFNLSDEKRLKCNYNCLNSFLPFSSQFYSFRISNFVETRAANVLILC